MSNGVFTRMKRFTFVEKTLAEVGDGTAYPLKATADQVAEVFYRVKDAWFTSGEVDLGTTGKISVYGTLAVGDPFVFGGGGDYRERAYGVQKDFDWANEDYYFQDAYTSGIPDFAYAYDIDTKERALFQPDDGDVSINYAQAPTSLFIQPDVEFDANVTNYPEITFRCGFSHLHNCDSLPTASYGIYAYPEGSSPTDATETKSSVVFSGQVAWVDVNGSGNPIDPLNELYIGVRFSALTFYGSSAPPLWIGTDDDYYTDPLYCDFVIELASSTLRCPMYCDIIGGFTSSSDFVMTAKEWWPYAKDSPAVPVWDTDTGLKL
jgi:hypothetical protein